MEQLDKWGTFVLTNLFWIVLSFPILTMPIATAGLFKVMSKWVRGKQPEFFQDFFGGMRQHWLNALLIALLDMVAGAFVLMNTSILIQMEAADPFAIVARAVTVFAALLLLLINLYVWSLLVISQQSLYQIIQLSFKLVIVHPVWSLGIMIAAAIPILVSLLLPKMIFLFVPISLSALLINRGTWQIIRQYIPEDERSEFEAKSIS